MNKKLSHLKGFIAEEICKFHIKRAGFKIINSGKEWFDKDLADELVYNKSDSNNHTLNIFNKIIAKLPDFMIWRNLEEEDIEYKFVEVKYRKKLDKKSFVPSVTKKGYPYLKYECNNPKDDSLNVYKYMKNLEKLMILENDSLTNDLRNIEFYIYLVTSSDMEKKTNIYFGKVFGSFEKGYVVYFHEPKEVSERFGDVWKNYLDVANYLLDKKKIDKLYENESMLVYEDYKFTQEHIHTMLLS